jgi:2-aminobenzoate-CoA ligase
VAEVAVVGAPDEDRGVVGKACVVLLVGNNADDEMRKQLQDHVKRVIAPYKYPRQVEFVAELPKTTTGKLQRHRLREIGE